MPFYLGDGSVVPDVAFVRENISNIAQRTFLYILLDGVQQFFGGNLDNKVRTWNQTEKWAQL